MRRFVAVTLLVVVGCAEKEESPQLAEGSQCIIVIPQGDTEFLFAKENMNYLEENFSGPPLPQLEPGATAEILRDASPPVVGAASERTGGEGRDLRSVKILVTSGRLKGMEGWVRRRSLRLDPSL
jgi:hypothetical protein